MDTPVIYTVRLKFKQKDGSLRIEYDTIVVGKYKTLKEEIKLVKEKYKDSAVGDVEVQAKISTRRY